MLPLVMTAAIKPTTFLIIGQYANRLNARATVFFFVTYGDNYCRIQDFSVLQLLYWATLTTLVIETGLLVSVLSYYSSLSRFKRIRRQKTKN
jgi:hypothetical protein